MVTSAAIISYQRFIPSRWHCVAQCRMPPQSRLFVPQASSPRIIALISLSRRDQSVYVRTTYHVHHVGERKKRSRSWRCGEAEDLSAWICCAEYLPVKCSLGDNIKTPVVGPERLLQGLGWPRGLFRKPEDWRRVCPTKKSSCLGLFPYTACTTKLDRNNSPKQRAPCVLGDRHQYLESNDVLDSWLMFDRRPRKQWRYVGNQSTRILPPGALHCQIWAAKYHSFQVQ